MKPYLTSLVFTLLAGSLSLAQAQVPPGYARSEKPLLNGQIPFEAKNPSIPKGYVWAQIPSDGKVLQYPTGAGAEANDEIKALLKAQTEVIKALSAKVDAMETRLVKVETGRK